MIGASGATYAENNDERVQKRGAHVHRSDSIYHGGMNGVSRLSYLFVITRLTMDRFCLLRNRHRTEKFIGTRLASRDTTNAAFNIRIASTNASLHSLFMFSYTRALYLAQGESLLHLSRIILSQRYHICKFESVKLFRR